MMDILDKVVNWQEARLVWIAGRPMMGKTNFTLNQIIHKILSENASILYFHLEEETENIITRLLAIRSGISYQNLQEGKLSPKEWKRIKQTIQEMKEWKLYFDANHRIERIKKQIRKSLQEKSIHYVVIDSWQNLSSENEQCLSREEELEKMAKELRELAEELQICIICTTQLTRAPEKRENHKPRLTDFCHSQKSVQLVDTILLLYRDSYNQPKNHPQMEKMEVILARENQTINYQVNWKCLQIKEEKERK